MLTPEALVTQVGGRSYQVRTGVLLVPERLLGTGPDLSARLGIDWVDLVSWKLDHLIPGSGYLGLNANAFIQDLDTLVREPRVASCVLLGNTDVLLARLTDTDREQVWTFLYESFRKRPVGVVVMAPEKSFRLFSAGQRKLWEAAERLATLGHGGGQLA